MPRRLREYWREFRHAPPGDRFRSRYRRRLAERAAGDRQWSRPLLIVSAVGCGLIAVPLMFVPGPAFLFWALAGFLMAGESRRAARWLDQGELALRRILRPWFHRDNTPRQPRDRTEP